MGKFEKIASVLADRYTAIQSMKTAADPPKRKSIIDENPTKPGINLPMGLGAGLLGSAAEYNAGSYGGVESLMRLQDRLHVSGNPFSRINSEELDTIASKNPTVNTLREIMQSHDDTGGPNRRTMQNLFRKYYGGRGSKKPGYAADVYGQMEKLIDPGNTDLMKKWKDLVTPATELNPDDIKQARKFFRRVSRTGMATPEGMAALDGWYNKLKGAKTTEHVDAIKDSISKMLVGKVGKGGVRNTHFINPTLVDRLRGAVMNDNWIRSTPVSPGATAAKQREVANAFSKIMQGRGVPRGWARLRNAGTAGGLAAAAGSIALPSLLGSLFGKTKQVEPPKTP